MSNPIGVPAKETAVPPKTSRAAQPELAEAYAPLDAVLQQVEMSPGAIRPSDSHHLQQTAGNRAIGRKLLPHRPLLLMPLVPHLRAKRPMK